MTPKLTKAEMRALAESVRCAARTGDSRCELLSGHEDEHLSGNGSLAWGETHVVMTPEMMRGVPNTPGTPRRTIRVPDALWDAAAEKAKERGEDLSTVLRKALERYVKRR